jgi:hypothetical protein
MYAVQWRNESKHKGFAECVGLTICINMLGYEDESQNTQDGIEWKLIKMKGIDHVAAN